MTIQSNRQAQPEREQTDESLRAERENTDRALSERQTSVEREADEVVERARESADAVLLETREKADHQRRGRPSDDAACVADARALEDQAVGTARAAADEAVQRERDESARVLASLLPLEREKTDRYLLTERDLSDDALSSRDDFLGIVSHDLRNLLGGIVMSAALLTKSAAKDDAGKELVAGTARIERYAARMNRLINDLVDVASIDAGRLGITPAESDLGAIVVEAVEAFARAAEAKEIAVDTEVLGAPLRGTFDHDRIFQVLANLIANAIKFTPKGGNISIRAEREADALRLSVSDSGTGIPGEMLEQVFERFWQVSENDRRGSGLGLYIARCVVEAHGGAISATSTLGEGSVFTVTLPTSTGRPADGAEGRRRIGP